MRMSKSSQGQRRSSAALYLRSMPCLGALSTEPSTDLSFLRFLSLEYPFTSWQWPSHAESLAYDLASDAEEGCDLAHRDAIAVELVDSVVSFLDCPVLPQRFGEESRVDVGLDKHGCDVVHFHIAQCLPFRGTLDETETLSLSPRGVPPSKQYVFSATSRESTVSRKFAWNNTLW